MQLSKKQKNSAQFVAPFLKFLSHFKQFERKDNPHGLCILEITGCQRRG